MRAQNTSSIGLKYNVCGILLGESLTVKNYWGLLTGDDGVGFRRIQNISSIGGFESKSRN